MQLEASCLSHALVSSPSVVAVSVEVQSQIDALLEQAFPEAVVSRGGLCTSLVVDHVVPVSVTERSSGALAERSTPLDAIREQVLCGATPRVPPIQCHAGRSGHPMSTMALEPLLAFGPSQPECIS